MSGDPSPNCTGYYDEAGSHDGEPYYERRTLPLYYLWWDGDNIQYRISTTAPNGMVGGYWTKATPITGSYGPQGGYTGNPIVAAP